MLSRRHAAQDRSAADTQAGSFPADAPVGRRERRSAERTSPGYLESQPGLPRQGTSRHAFPAHDAPTGALPASPAWADQGRTSPGSYPTRPEGYPTRADDYLAHPDAYRTRPEGYPTRADDYLAQPDTYRTRPDDSRARPDDYRTQPGRSTAAPEQDPARPLSGPHAGRRAARQAPGSSAPWPAAPRPAESRLAPPEQARRPAGRRGADPASGSATTTFERPAATAATAATAAVEAPPVRRGPVKPAQVKPAPAKQRSSDDREAGGRRSARRKRRHPILVGLVGGGVVGAVAAGGILVTGVLGGSSGPTHHIVAPDKLLSYTQNPSLAKGMGAEALRNDILAKGNGEASHVVDAVYEDAAGAGAKASPEILLFVGGNLSGSAGSFISSFTGELPGSFVINAGALGGQAACVPGAGGHPAECAWADGDTFGLLASPALSARTLAAELRSIRPLVELSDK